MGILGGNMTNKKIFLTGATGSMGMATLKALVVDTDYDLVLLIRPTRADRKRIQPFLKAYGGAPKGGAGLDDLDGRHGRIKVVYGDLTVYEDILRCVTGADVILHCGALVSPLADDNPDLAMRVNYGAMLHLIKAIKAQPNADQIRLVSVGTIAQTGDRMPPIHWGQVGDPIKPSVHDYYAVSKIAAERALIESGLKYWVSLRQTGILSEKMAKIKDPIIFHNCLDNVLEYVTDHDSGVLMRNCCGELPDDFWGHIYNIGGGPACRISCFQMFQEMFEPLGFTNLEHIIDAKWFALRNFHGQYYLDSDVLEGYLHFRSQDKTYFYQQYLKRLGWIVPLARVVNRLPGGQRLMGKVIRSRFEGLLHAPRGPLHWLKHNKEEWIKPFFISRTHWEQIPRLSEFQHFTDWDQVVPLSRGYDTSKPEAMLSLEDVQAAAQFRGGHLLSNQMVVGDWTSRLRWACAFGHEFDASPRLILEGGHWCPVCEAKSWNYHEIAKVNPFFAQVWYPLHAADEPSVEYPKVSVFKEPKEHFHIRL